MFFRLLKNIGALTVGELVSKVLGFVVTILLARKLGETQFGQYAYALSMITILAVISNCGVSTLIVKDVARQRSLAGEYLGKAVMLRSVLATALIGVAVALNLMLGFSWELNVVVFMLSLSLPFQLLSLSCQAVFQAFEQMQYIAAMSIARSALSLALILVVLVAGYSVSAVALMQTISFAIVACVAFYYLKRAIGSVRLAYPPEALVAFAKQGLPFLYIMILYILYYKMDIIMLQKMRGATEVGWYSAAYELVIGFYMIPTILATVLFPVLCKQAVSSRGELRSSCVYAMKFLAVVGVPLSAVMVFCAKEIISLVYGDRYAPSGTALEVLALTFVVFFPNVIMSYVLTALGKIKDLVWINAIGLGVNIVLNVYLISVYGYVGASIATVVSLTLVTCACYWRLIRNLGSVPFFALYNKPVMAVGSSILLTSLFGIENLFAVLVSVGCLYSLCLLALKGVSKEEIVLIRNAVAGPVVAADS